MNPTPEDPLDQLLKSTQTSVELPRRFQANVWQRIADRETASAWTPARRWIEEWSLLLTRPRYATALVAAVMLLAAGVAEMQSHAAQSGSSDMQARYVSMIDPYAQINR